MPESATSPGAPLAGEGGPAPPLPALETLRGVGPKLAERLSRLGVESTVDLLLHLPYRYEDRTRIAPIGTLVAGSAAVVCGHAELSQVSEGRRPSLGVLISDGTGRLVLRFFHFSEAQRRKLTRGARLWAYGEVRRSPRGAEMVHPEYRILTPGAAVPVEETLTPVYPLTEGVSQATLRRLIAQALEALSESDALGELLPESVRRGLDFPTLGEALAFLHRPPPDTSAAQLTAAELPAHRRVAFEELLAHHLSLRMVRRSLEHQRAPALAGEGGLRRALSERLPFALTAAQGRVCAELARDLERPHPMSRLLQGDVGSGKTVVAAMCALQALEAGHQVAFMAPTDLLAEQHYENLAHWLGPLGVSVVRLSGHLPAGARRRVRDAIAEGSAAIAVGTHALFQNDVVFARLGLLVIDEQHRFGVGQRLALRAKGVRDGLHPHQLVMTATPIPRTLAMTAYADLDVSVIDGLPPGRTPVDTAVLPGHRRDELVERVRSACASGQQAYWVCPLIEESDVLEAQAAAETARTLAAALPEVSVGLVHGRMRAVDKDAAMLGFKSGRIQLLVATTVVEVGVDVPNASVMVIENAERMGLAQLHQLRGRVGRGAPASYCLLLYEPPLSRMAKERLAVMRRTTDGFEIAQRDLELRGPGEVLGTRQTGLARLRVADYGRDRALFGRIAPAADRILRERPEHVPLLIRRWIRAAISYAEA